MHSTTISEIPSRSITFLETLILLAKPIPITAMTDTAGITMLLKIALPAVVPIPPENPVASDNTKRKNNEVNSSGIELAMAFIDAPLTPSDKFRPIYSEAVMKPSPALQMITQLIAIKINGIIMPIFCIILSSALAQFKVK
jgi:hypothetical protein